MNVNDPRWASIDAFVEENRDNILRDITRLVAVPSVEGAPEPGAPFGPGPKAALAKALEIADELGLDTFNADSYIGWAETGRIADGQKFLATITHTDIEIPSFAGPMHGANEGTPFEKLVEALKIYILALLRLQEIEL